VREQEGGREGERESACVLRVMQVESHRKKMTKCVRESESESKRERERERA